MRNAEHTLFLQGRSGLDAVAFARGLRHGMVKTAPCCPGSEGAGHAGPAGVAGRAAAVPPQF